MRLWVVIGGVLCSLWALAVLGPEAVAQTQLFDSHLVVMGHENSCAPTTASGTAYACNLLRLPTTPAYTTGACYQFIADVANTGPPSINFSSMGAKTIKKVTGGITTDLVANDIRVGHIVKVCYDGVNMQCQNCTGVSPAATVFNVKDFGATGDGSTNDAPAITAAITAAAAGDTLLFPRPAVAYRLTTALAINKSLTLTGEQATLKQATAGTKGLLVSASAVVVRGLTLTGTQAGTYNDNERAIEVTGPSAAAALTQIDIADCTITGWGGYGLWLQYVTGFDVRGNAITSIGYAGVMVVSGRQGTITSNRIETITPGTAGNAYGISLTRNDVASLVTDPRSADIVVSHNYIANVTFWAGIDSHMGQRLAITSNQVVNTLYPISIGASNANSFAPLDIVIANNVAESTVTDGSRGTGIMVQGAGTVSGSPTETAKNVIITGNVVRGHGSAASVGDGGIVIYNTEGAVISNNTLYQPSPRGIQVYWNNFGFTVTGNTVIDPWTNTGAVGDANGIAVTVDFNTGFIGGNTLRRGSKSASFVLTSGIYISNNATNIINMGNNYSEATLLLNDAGLHSQALFVSPVTLDRGAGGCLMFRDTNGSTWTKCKTLSGVMTCTTDTDGVCN